jgi:L-ascorbate metabolism protein UlaG (beta-lactamase superfamily)
MPPFAVTRVVNACVLLELGDDVVLTDPWFTDRWYNRFGEPHGLPVERLPRLSAIVGTHALPNHWDIGALRDYAWKRSTPVLVANEAMAAQALAVGFGRTEVVPWGETRRVGPCLTCESVPAHVSLGRRVSSYVLESGDLRVFFGGEARDLAPIVEYRARHAATDVVLAPVNGLCLMGAPLVMGPVEAIAAAAVLGARTFVAIHDAHDSIAGPLMRRRGTAGDVATLAGGALEVRILEPGRRWTREARDAPSMRRAVPP